MSRRTATFFLLIVCAMLSLAGTDLVLPAVPELPRLFGSSEAAAQLVLAAYVGGCGLGLLLFGRLADHIDRKPLLLISLAAFALASLACAHAPGIGTLIALRLVQGAAAAAAPVLGPGIIRQLFSDRGAVRAIGFLGSTESLVPALAPIAGAALLARYGWQSSFELLAALALAALALLALIGLPPQPRAVRARGNYRALLASPVFMRYALSHAMTLGGLITFVFGAPIVIIESMGGRLADFIVMQVINVAGFIIAANLSARAAERHGAEAIILAGTLLSAASGLALAAYGLAGGRDAGMLPWLFTPMAIGLGLRGPIGFYRGIVAAGDNNARGSALIIFFIFLMSTLGTVIAAPFITLGLGALAVVASAIHLLSVALLLWLPAMDPAAPENGS
ncbi:MFS transporter [Bordetella hinzii]|uniref:MFS transporter n=1 Tax=Bordetella hinzii TaxID=103855 RepID=UPI00045A786D|nr:MFS transporter [Bordetella hinzii]KCB49259.1 transporter, major facilitator family protein [Bordetella hinzii 4161]KXA71900.1 hypothetical protein AXA74_15980 [Bordetella hinzii LMG 13501]QDJ36102.1 MFS transporter [Bordetella hinzii]QDJ49644.1 MFS transporter [Bordetella hinzii]VEH29490.1 bicyclomycin resistance protein (transporter) [Bordetella hinzii]